MYYAKADASERERAAEEAEAMITAIVAGDVSEVEALLLGGVPVNMADNMRRTALHYACYSGNKSIAALLIDFNAELESR